MTDVLPTGVHFVRTVGTDWNCTNSTQTVICTYQGSTSAPISMVSGVDPTPENNASSDPTKVPLSMITIDKSLKGSISEGGTAKYVLTITNEGPSTTRGVAIINEATVSGGNVVNHDPLSPTTISSIREQVENDPTLAIALGMTQDKKLPDTDTARAVVKANSLAFTGSTIRLVLGLTILLLLLGAALFITSRRREEIA